MDEKYFIPVHVVGCLIFNEKLSSKVFLTYPNIHNDANLTIHVIQHVLNTWEGPLPPILYLQLDNTARENKNKYVMAYLNMLVELGTFEKIKVGFLLVGHTHDQIDQMFSKFSVKLNKQRAFMLETLVEIIKSSYKPQADVIFVDETADFRKFVSDKDQPNARGVGGRVLEELQLISYQRQFRFKKYVNEDGVTGTLFHAKHLSSTREWGEAVDFLQYIPTSPMWVAPQMPLKGAIVGDQSTDEEVAMITLEKYRKAIMEEGFNYFNNEEKVWWMNFFEKQKDIIFHHLRAGEWGYQWVWPRQRLQETIAPCHEEREEVDEQLTDKIAGPERIMYSGTRKRTIQLGDFKDLEENNKWSMIAVAASDGMPFWMAKVTKILDKINDVPQTVKVLWFTTESGPDAAMDGKYYPEKSTSKKLLTGELCLPETTVYAYNFALLGNQTLPITTKRIITEAINP
jgi:hypothetical protein